MAESVTIKVGGATVEMRRPTSYTAILDVIRVLNDNYHRGLGACIGACWPKATPWPGERQPSQRLLAMDGLDYGGRVIDDMHKAGIPFASLVDGAQQVAEMLIRYQISEKEVAEAVNFSEAPKEGQTEP